LIVGLALLLVLFLPPMIVDAMTDDVQINSTLIYMVKLVSIGVILSTLLIIACPIILKFVIPDTHRVPRAGTTNKKPFYMFPIFFLFVVSFISAFRLIRYWYMLYESTVARILLDTPLDAIFFFSAILLASLLFAIFKKGYGKV
jgi:hypothetical protein